MKFNRLAGIAVLAASAAIIMTPVHAQATVHISPSAWRLDISDVDTDTQNMFRDMISGKTAAVVIPGVKTHFDGYCNYPYSTYLKYINKLVDTGHYNVIAAEKDPMLGDRTAEVPDTSFRYNLSIYTGQIRDEIQGSDTVQSNIADTLQKAGITDGMSQTEAVRRIAMAVQDKFVYDLAYANADLSDAIAAGHGVCWQYAEFFEYCCDVCGIECETQRSKEHAWNKTVIDGVDQYTDVTFCDTGKSNQYILMTAEQNAACPMRGDFTY